ncbi:Myb family transcription factor APL [Acorus calamus]|uniref:Myb family transcription factor APL n=1 Tax=Acorus calamus TaxID=4465 RepID=A0AAV9CTP6_ACOCL|nr:Myb family transcription factor APL [Acorus calamus]
MFHHHSKNSLLSSRTSFSPERQLFVQGPNASTNTGLVLSTDAKPRLKWMPELHERFIEAVNQLGGPDRATPKTIMRLMGIPGLTLYHLKSHLQKYRLSKNIHSQANIGITKSSERGSTAAAAAAADRMSEIGGALISNSELGTQTNKSLQISEALQMQIEVQRRLHEQLEVQRHLQLRIEAQGKYLQSVLEKAQETLGQQNVGSQKDHDAPNAKKGLKPYPDNAPMNRTQEEKHESCQRAYDKDLNGLKTFSSMRREPEKMIISEQRDSDDLSMSMGVRGDKGRGSYHPDTSWKETDVRHTLADQWPARQQDQMNQLRGYKATYSMTQLDLNVQDEGDDSAHGKQFDLNGFSWS